MIEPPFWEPVGFQDRINDWIQRQNPGLDLVNITIRWVVQQVGTPYVGVHRRPEVASNYWWGRVPGSYRDEGDGQESDVLCGYYIDEDLRQIRCDIISTLYRPNLGG